MMHKWLSGLNMADLTPLFIETGYDIATISRMTPEVRRETGVRFEAVKMKIFLIVEAVVVMKMRLL